MDMTFEDYVAFEDSLMTQAIEDSDWQTNQPQEESMEIWE